MPSVRPPRSARLPRSAAGRAMRGAALAGALTERLRYSGSAPCPLCDADGKRRTQDGTFHLFCECTHPAVQAEREALQSTLLTLLGRLTTLICNALRAQSAPAETRQRVSDLSDKLLTLAATANWNSRDGKAIIYRLVTVVPFPAKIATALPDLLSQLQLVHCLGQIFDSTVVQDRWLRPLANHWVKWAVRQIRRFAHVRADALGAAHPRGAENAADGDSADLSDASESVADRDDGSSNDDSSYDDSPGQETDSEENSDDSSDAD